MIDSISPYVTQILVSGRQVAVGTIGQSFTRFDKPMTPAEIQHAIYTKVQPFNMISAVLQQELLLYCGRLIASRPELFSGILVVRIGWILKALEIFREITMQNPDPIHSCSPHTIRKLVYSVLSESRAINLNNVTDHKISKSGNAGDITGGDDNDADDENNDDEK
jgi:phosphorylase kinase alpha/beta subunit